MLLGRGGNLQIIKTDLKENGDFRSPECLEILKESDIVVTNPPFSLFREFVDCLFKYNKKFLIIGHKHATAYKNIFQFIKDNKLWLGVSRTGNGDVSFILPENHQEIRNIKALQIDKENNKKYLKIPGICWLTNLEHKKKYKEFQFGKKYSEKEYKKFDNYDAINIDKTSHIPEDYSGYMGVPITFLSKYNPKQFEIIGLSSDRNHFPLNKEYKNPIKHTLNGKKTKFLGINKTFMLTTNIIPKTTYYTADNSDKYLIIPFSRIIIRRINI